MKKLALILAALLPCLPAMAQFEHIVPFLPELAQSTYQNPVTRPSHTLSIGLPASSVHLGMTNNFTLNDMIYTRGDSAYIDPGKYLGKADRNTFTRLQANVDLLHVRFRLGKAYYMFHIAERMQMRMSMNNDLLGLMWKGNGAYVGDNAARLDRSGFYAMHYREYGAGMNYEITDRLIVGGRVKLLFGKSMMRFYDIKGSLRTDTSGAYTLTADGSYKGQLSTGPVDFDKENEDFNRYAFYSGSPGVAIDLGASLKINEQVKFTAALNNLGFISWGGNTATLSGNLASAPFSGAAVTSSLVRKEKFDLARVRDSITQRFSSSEERNKRFSSPTVANILLAASYQSSAKTTLTAAALADLYIVPRVAVSLNAYQRISKVFQGGVAYTMHNRSFTNFGGGLVFTPGPLQFHLVIDDIVGLMRPLAANNLHVRFGMNLTFGHKRLNRDSDNDGVVDTEDKCPTIPGLRQFDGCPDSDHDGIADKDDVCPTEAGLPQFFGCPDSDEDGIPDREDKCPTQIGTKANQGCPE